MLRNDFIETALLLLSALLFVLIICGRIRIRSHAHKVFLKGKYSGLLCIIVASGLTYQDVGHAHLYSNAAHSFSLNSSTGQQNIFKVLCILILVYYWLGARLDSFRIVKVHEHNFLPLLEKTAKELNLELRTESEKPRPNTAWLSQTTGTVVQVRLWLARTGQKSSWGYGILTFAKPQGTNHDLKVDIAKSITRHSKDIDSVKTRNTISIPPIYRQ